MGKAIAIMLLGLLALSAVAQAAQEDMSADGISTVQAEDADVEFFHSAIAKKWGLCLWDKDCPRGEFCKKHHCERRESNSPPPTSPLLPSPPPPAGCIALNGDCANDKTGCCSGLDCIEVASTQFTCIYAI